MPNEKNFEKQFAITDVDTGTFDEGSSTMHKTGNLKVVKQLS